MDRVTLNYERYLAFTGWSPKHYTKQTSAIRQAKLSKMGVQLLSITGKGRNAKYVIEIPYSFWRMLLIPTMSFTEVGATYINYLLDGRDKLNTVEGNIVRFDAEMYEELVKLCGTEYESVKSTCIRVRNCLKENGYIESAKIQGDKTHRVKKRLKDGWVTGNEALEYNKKARAIWYSFFKEKVSMYQQIKPDATEVPIYLIRKEMRELYSFGMKEQLRVDYYRVAKKTCISKNLRADIQYARDTFLKTLNLAEVKATLSERQKIYRAYKDRQEEEISDTRDIIRNQQPTKEEMESEREAMKLIGLERESSCPPPTKEEQEEMMRFVEAAIFPDRDE